MARSPEQKKQLVLDYQKKIEAAQAIYFVEPSKLKANQSVELKKKFYKIDSGFNVIKNSLFKIALEKSNQPVPQGLEAKANAVIFSSDQISESAKVISEFIRENKGVLTITSGILNGKLIAAEKIADLANLPSREILLAQVLGTMKAPISGFVNVLAGNNRKLVTVINAIKEKKEKEA